MSGEQAEAEVLNAAADNRIFWKRTNAASDNFDDGDWLMDPAGAESHSSVKAQKLDGTLIRDMMNRGLVAAWGGLGMYELVVPEETDHA